MISWFKLLLKVGSALEEVVVVPFCSLLGKVGHIESSEQRRRACGIDEWAIENDLPLLLVLCVVGLTLSFEVQIH